RRRVGNSPLCKLSALCAGIVHILTVVPVEQITTSRLDLVTVLAYKTRQREPRTGRTRHDLDYSCGHYAHARNSVRAATFDDRPLSVVGDESTAATGYSHARNRPTRTDASNIHCGPGAMTTPERCRAHGMARPRGNGYRSGYAA